MKKYGFGSLATLKLESIVTVKVALPVAVTTCSVGVTLRCDPELLTVILIFLASGDNRLALMTSCIVLPLSTQSSSGLVAIFPVATFLGVLTKAYNEPGGGTGGFIGVGSGCGVPPHAIKLETAKRRTGRNGFMVSSYRICMKNRVDFWHVARD